MPTLSLRSAKKVGLWDRLYFTDGVIMGSAEFVRGFTGAWQRERERKYPPKVNEIRGTGWGDLAVIQSMRRKVFG